VRAHDSRGRHTTTSRSLLLAPGGGLILDTPGMRELQLWHGEEGLSDAFGDVAALAEGCRFRDCSHEAEPGCAVQEAVLAGGLSEERLSSYRKLERELRHLAMKQDQRAQSAEKQKWKSIHKAMRQHYKSQS
jgi:ribosome biogenesis GTPase / thiamine phosphate phosphatase